MRAKHWKHWKLETLISQLICSPQTSFYMENIPTDVSFNGRYDSFWKTQKEPSCDRKRDGFLMHHFFWDTLYFTKFSLVSNLV